MCEGHMNTDTYIKTKYMVDSVWWFKGFIGICLSWSLYYTQGTSEKRSYLGDAYQCYIPWAWFPSVTPDLWQCYSTDLNIVRKVWKWHNTVMNQTPILSFVWHLCGTYSSSLSSSGSSAKTPVVRWMTLPAEVPLELQDRGQACFHSHPISFQ